MGLLYGENCKILTSTVFAWITRVTDRRTDGRTDRQTDRRNCDSICALSIDAVARKNITVLLLQHLDMSCMINNISILNMHDVQRKQQQPKHTHTYTHTHCLTAIYQVNRVSQFAPHFQSSLIPILSILVEQAKTLHIHHDTIPPSLPWCALWEIPSISPEA